MTVYEFVKKRGLYFMGTFIELKKYLNTTKDMKKELEYLKRYCYILTVSSFLTDKKLIVAYINNRSVYYNISYFFKRIAYQINFRKSLNH